ncbi:hypothetical protein PAPHI01_1959 [Pancytospora philotis]|nr:hypothetical protein PAPHI01_1959 [Pancytospora philotis]
MYALIILPLCWCVHTLEDVRLARSEREATERYYAHGVFRLSAAEPQERCHEDDMLIYSGERRSTIIPTVTIDNDKNVVRGTHTHYNVPSNADRRPRVDNPPRNADGSKRRVKIQRYRRPKDFRRRKFPKKSEKVNPLKFDVHTYKTPKPVYELYVDPNAGGYYR